MAIYRHPDGTYHRYPFKENAPEVLKPIPGRPGWFTNRAGTETYREPPKPPLGIPS